MVKKRIAWLRRAVVLSLLVAGLSSATVVTTESAALAVNHRRCMQLIDAWVLGSDPNWVWAEGHREGCW